MAKARILVVEDELNLLEGIKTVLEIDGFAVTTAENGKQALVALHDAARSGTGALPELIVSDIMMPHMDALTCCARFAPNNSGSIFRSFS